MLFKTRHIARKTEINFNCYFGPLWYILIDNTIFSLVYDEYKLGKVVVK